MPAPRLPWFRVWMDATTHEKVRQLDDAKFRTWVELLDAASKQSWRGRFSNRASAAALVRRPKAHVATLIVARLIDEDPDEHLTMHDWDEWQRWRKEDSNDSRTSTERLPNGHANGARRSTEQTTNGRSLRVRAEGEGEVEGDKDKDAVVAVGSHRSQSAVATAATDVFIDEFEVAIGVAPNTLTTTFRNRERSIAGQLIRAGAPPGEPPRFVAWYRACYASLPSDMRVYEAKRTAFLAGISPPQRNRNGRIEQEHYVPDHTGCPAGCTKDHR